MIIYGSRSTELASKILSEPCGNCGTQNALSMHIIQKYVHIFWIPFFPMRKTGITQCTNCKQVLQAKEMTPSLRITYDDLKSQTKTPIWNFAGIILLAALLIAGGIRSNQNNERNTVLIDRPQKGDIYEIKLDYKQYTLYKVNNVAGDSVYVFANEFETNKRRGLKELKKRGDMAFIPEPFSIHKAKLKAMFENGEVINVDRTE